MVLSIKGGNSHHRDCKQDCSATDHINQYPQWTIIQGIDAEG